MEIRDITLAAPSRAYGLEDLVEELLDVLRTPFYADEHDEIEIATLRAIVRLLALEEKAAALRGELAMAHRVRNTE